FVKDAKKLTSLSEASHLPMLGEQSQQLRTRRMRDVRAAGARGSTHRAAGVSVGTAELSWPPTPEDLDAIEVVEMGPPAARVVSAPPRRVVTPPATRVDTPPVVVRRRATVAVQAVDAFDAFRPAVAERVEPDAPRMARPARRHGRGRARAVQAVLVAASLAVAVSLGDLRWPADWPAIDALLSDLPVPFSATVALSTPVPPAPPDVEVSAE